MSFARRPRTRLHPLAALGASAALVAALSPCAPAWAQARPGSQPNAAGIYSCMDDSGRRITSDRPIVACIGREQRVLNSDGSVRKVLPPSMTADERAQYEEAERERAAERRTLRDITRRDQNLVQRYPDEVSHRRARTAALDDVRKAVKSTEARLLALAEERKPLMNEAEFYVNRQLPQQLKAAIDANDAATEAQRAFVMFQQAEIERINATFDLELQRLKKLWAGARPGSLGPLETMPTSGTAPEPRR